MAKRAANGRGAVRQRPDGRWEVRLSYLDPSSGERQRISVYGATQKAALAELDRVQDRLEEGKPPKDSTATVASWMAHWRQTTLAASDRKAATRELYSNLSRKHIEADPFGAIRLDRLRPSDIEALVLALRDNGLSDSTIRQTYTVLRQALDGACRDELLARNPAAVVKRPGVERTEAKHLPPDAVSRLLRAAEGSRYYPVLLLIATTGLRRGEAVALHWDQVDLDAGLIKVAATMSRVDGQLRISEPKTARSRRTVPLTPAMIAVLRKHKVTQMKERIRAANVWTDTGLVFTTELGTRVEPRNILRVIETASAKAGVTEVTVHTLRHSAAVAWLEAGVHIRQVADLLGHSSVSVTGDVYGHGSEGGARAAVLALADRLNL